MALLRCIICDIPLYKQRNGEDSDINTCYRCGEYEIVRSAIPGFSIHFDSTRKRSILSGWLRRNQRTIISTDTHKKFENFRIPSVPKRASELLLYISQILPNIGQYFSSKFLFGTYEHVQNPHTDVVGATFKESAIKFMPMIAESWSQNWEELHYLLQDYLTNSKRYLQLKEKNWLITPDGWAEI